MIECIVQTKSIFGCKLGMYWDGAVKVCTGIELKSMAAAVSLPFDYEGRAATKSEILFDWNTVKLNRSLGERIEGLTRVRLSGENADRIVGEQIKRIQKEYRIYFFQFNWWPLSAQLAVSLMTMPELRLHPELMQTLREGDWKTAAAYCEKALKAEERRNVIVEAFKRSG